MKHQTDSIREQVSALADGELQGDAFAAAMEVMGSSPELRASWQSYHVVGDVLRSGAHAPCSDSHAFLSRLQGRLATEARLPDAVLPPPVVLAVQARAESANEPVFRWKLVAGAASIAAVAAISWNWVGGAGIASPGAQMAQQQVQPPAVSVLAASDPNSTNAVASAVPTRVQVGNGGPQVMLRDPRLDELLSAHQQAGGGSQMPSTFLRNATFEGPSR